MINCVAQDKSVNDDDDDDFRPCPFGVTGMRGPGLCSFPLGMRTPATAEITDLFDHYTEDIVKTKTGQLFVRDPAVV